MVECDSSEPMSKKSHITPITIFSFFAITTPFTKKPLHTKSFHGRCDVICDQGVFAIDCGVHLVPKVNVQVESVVFPS
jgi:hypothetical protein